MRTPLPIPTADALLALITSVDGYMINGLLDDWGVPLHIQWIPSAYSVSWIEQEDFGSGHPNFPIPPHIIEGRFHWSTLGNPTQPFNLHWTESCGNDVLNLTANPVPEPGGRVLLGSGCAVLGGVSWRRSKKK